MTNWNVGNLSQGLCVFGQLQFESVSRSEDGCGMKHVGSSSGSNDGFVSCSVGLQMNMQVGVFLTLDNQGSILFWNRAGNDKSPLVFTVDRHMPKSCWVDSIRLNQDSRNCNTGSSSSSTSIVH